MLTRDFSTVCARITCSGSPKLFTAVRCNHTQAPPKGAKSPPFADTEGLSAFSRGRRMGSSG